VRTTTLAIAAAVACLLPGCAASDQAAAATTTATRPCALHPVTIVRREHTGGPVTRRACLQAYRRARLDYPPRPTWREAMARTSEEERAVMLRIGRCEMSTRPAPARRESKAHPPTSSPWARLRWGLDLPRYSTAFGIWNGNGAYIRQVTSGYSFPGATPAEELLGAVALARRYHYSAWSCY